LFRGEPQMLGRSNDDRNGRHQIATQHDSYRQATEVVSTVVLIYNKSSAQYPL
jgi:hypothetical protein